MLPLSNEEIENLCSWIGAVQVVIDQRTLEKRADPGLKVS